MDKSEDLHPESKSENKAASDPAKIESARPEKKAAGDLPMVNSPNLGDGSAGESAEETVNDSKARFIGALPTLLSDRGNGAASEAAAAAAGPQRRSFRFALLAATIACAAGIGALAGSLTASGFGHKDVAAVGTARSPNPHDVAQALKAQLGELSAANPHDLVQALKAQLAELSALKASLDTANRNANAEFARLTERINSLEHAQADPTAKLAHIVDSVDRIEKRMSAGAEITGSIGAKPPQAPAAPDANIPAPVLHDWAVQGVRGGRAMVESRYGALFLVGNGSLIPGLGHVHEIKRQNGQWIVVTSKGLITQHP